MTNLANDSAPEGFATYPTEGAAFEVYEIPADDIIDGKPSSEVVVHYQSPDGSILVAVARTGVGKYTYRQTADEFNYITRGRLLITSDQEEGSIECTPGSVTRLNKGATYTKTVTQPYEEISIMLSKNGVQM